jgi:hypothetical protein
MTASNVKMGGKILSATDLSEFPNGVLRDPSTRFVQLDGTLLNTDLTAGSGPGVTAKGIQVGTAGTIDGIDAQGNAFSGFPVTTGWNKIVIKQLTAVHTAANIWGLY